MSRWHHAPTLGQRETPGMGCHSARHLRGVINDYINDTMTISPGLAADQAAQQKMDKYSKLLSTHIFCPVAVETAGTRNGLTIELVQEIGRRTTAITEDARETVFLFQRLSTALQQGNVSPSKTQCPPNESPLQPLTLFFNIYAHRLCAGGHKNSNNNKIIIIIYKRILKVKRNKCFSRRCCECCGRVGSCYKSKCR